VVEHVVPGRAGEARPPSEEEVRQTAVLELAIEQASAKIRAGGPIEEPADLDLDVWGGVVPVSTTFGPPAADGAGLPAALPASVRDYRRPA
jgi:hypothetical protein